MSFENTQCPCGGKKERDTMLCAACAEYVAPTIDAASLNDHRIPWQSRRNAAIRVLKLCRDRNRSLALSYQF
jgi:hypothetical protein